MPKPSTVWITINCGKFFKRWEYQIPDLPLFHSGCTIYIPTNSAKVPLYSTSLPILVISYLFDTSHSDRLTSLVAQMVKRLPTLWEVRVQSLGREDLLVKGMATHSSILAPSKKGAQRRVSLVVQRLKHLPTMWETWVQSLGREDPWRRKWQPTPLFLPGISHGWRSLVGYVQSMGSQRVGHD